MRVYQINVVCGKGSTGRIAVDLSREIEENNGVCRIAYGRGIAPANVNAFKITTKAEVLFHALMTRLTDKHGLYSKKATLRLIEDIRAFGPDIIQVHNIHGYYLNYEVLFDFLKEYNRPVVWTLHDCWPFTGHCAHYENVGCEKWRTECNRCENASSYPRSFTNINCSRNYALKRKVFSSIGNMTVVVPSDWMKAQMAQSFLKNYDCRTIYNGIDLTVFRPTQKEEYREKLRTRGKVLLLGVASVWTRNKGLNDFIRLRTLLDDRYVMCMVGLSKKQIKSLPKGIIGIESTESADELAKYYSAADIFLNLTYGDTFPTTNIEALACGTPVLTYKTGGSPEIIDECSGWSVQKGDLKKICKIIENFVSDAQRNKACLARASQFNKSETYMKYIDLYKKKLERGEKYDAGERFDEHI